MKNAILMFVLMIGYMLQLAIAGAFGFLALDAAITQHSATPIVFFVVFVVMFVVITFPSKAKNGTL